MPAMRAAATLDAAGRDEPVLHHACRARNHDLRSRSLRSYNTLSRDSVRSPPADLRLRLNRTDASSDIGRTHGRHRRLSRVSLRALPPREWDVLSREISTRDVGRRSLCDRAARRHLPITRRYEAARLAHPITKI